MALFDRPPVFIVGAQRSGTTWVQRLLGAHSGTVTGQESHLFSGYLAPLWQRWQFESDFRASGSRTIGLGCYLTEEQFTDLLRRIAREVFAGLEQAKPGTVLLVEKTPDHGLHLPLIHRLFPGAALVHVVRDGRDVVASLRQAYRQQWGRLWAPASVDEAARRWVAWVEEIRSHAGRFDRCHEVRYEDMVAHGPDCLAALFEFVGVPLPPAEVAAIYERQRFDACAGGAAPGPLVLGGLYRGGEPAEPAGFFRQGKVGSWQEDLSPQEKAIVHAVAGPLLAELGYPVPASADGAADCPAAPQTVGFVSTVPAADMLWVKPGRLAAVHSGRAQLLHRERLYLYATVLALAPPRCLEIGVAGGGASRIIADALRDLGRGRLVALDPHLRLDYDPESVADVVTFLAGASPGHLRRAKALAGGPFDFVLLDGDHGAEGVRRDLEGLAGVTGPGAVILAHDAYHAPVAAGIDAALDDGLPYTDAGILATTRHDGLENGRQVCYAGFRLLVRGLPPRRGRGKLHGLARRVPRMIARELRAVVRRLRAGSWQ
jgi:predicted O-methyltransferase YrrM